jgi:hypothetical protein
MSEECPAQDPITWEGPEPDEGAPGAFEILCESRFTSPFMLERLAEEAAGQKVDYDVMFRPTHLFSWRLRGERRTLRVSQGYDLNIALPSYHAGLDHEMPTVRAECERLLRNLRTTEGVLFAAGVEEGDDFMHRHVLRMLDEALRTEGRRLADLPFVFLLDQGPATGVLYFTSEGVAMNRPLERLSNEALLASLQMPVSAYLPVYPREKRGYVDGLATLATMIAARRGLPAARE